MAREVAGGWLLQAVFLAAVERLNDPLHVGRLAQAEPSYYRHSGNVNRLVQLVAVRYGKLVRHFKG